MIDIETVDERAAILEYEGGMSRADADREAMQWWLCKVGDVTAQLRELRQRDRHRPRGPDGMILLGETER